MNIILNDGSILENVQLVGQLLRTNAKLDKNTLAPKFLGVKFQEKDTAGNLLTSDAQFFRLVGPVRNISGLYEVALEEIPAAELEQLKRDAKLEYVAMMAGVELPD